MSFRIRKRRREASSWRDVLKIHPAAELFPRMPDDELRELGADIKAHGLKQPIVSWSPGYIGDGVKDRPRYVLDGISRLDAMELAGLPLVGDEGELTGARFDQLWEKERVCSTASGRQIKPGTDPYAYVISANIRRRHLTAEQKRELIAKLIKATPEKSDRAIAKTAKVDHKTVGAVRGNLEARGEVPHVATRKDAKGRRQPARKPERHKVPTESRKQVARQVTLQGAARMGVAKAKSELNEVARLRTRIQELEAKVHQLNHEKLALQSEVDELRARVSGMCRRAASPIARRRRANMRRAEY